MVLGGLKRWYWGDCSGGIGGTEAVVLGGL